MTNQDLYNDCKRLYDILVAVSTGENYDNPKLTEEFNRSRRNLIREDFFIDLLPGFVKKYRDLPSFWGFIKNEYKSYSDRRRFLAEQFSPLFDYLEYHEPAAPIEGIVSSAAKMSSDYIHEIWVKALGRRYEDPEGAITAARTLLEATCKYTLDNQNVQYDDSADLNKLYKLASLELNLAPSQHTEQQFKQILGGAESVVNGLSSLRNKLSDAHAIGLKYSRPSSRHAVLCVNMAGAVSEYLISTYEMKVKMA